MSIQPIPPIPPMDLSFDDDTEFLANNHAMLANRCAIEGVPVGAIARIIQQPFGIVHDSLKAALAQGVIFDIPRADWPPSQKRDEREPTSSRQGAGPTLEEIEFACTQTFRLTPLETAFILVLLQVQFASKEKLHGVIEHQRGTRVMRPDKLESTDPKMVDVMICKLRKKLRDKTNANVIETSWGKGYFIEPAMKETILNLIGVSHAQPAADPGSPGGVSGHSGGEREAPAVVAQ